MRRVLVHTIPPYDGGVPAKAQLLCRHLRGLGWDVAVAWYATLGHEPHLVAPAWRPGTRPGTESRPVWDGFPGTAIGCRFPETETAYYRLTPPWRDLMRGFERHVAVGGNVLVAHRLVEAGLPHMLWCAALVADDRIDRQRAMSAPRRLLDRWVTMPTLERMEQRVLNATPTLMPVAHSGRRRFTEMGRRHDPVEVLPVPVDTALFTPAAASAPAGVVGFAGRMGDPRKNVGLLLKAVAAARRGGVPLRLRLTGDPVPALAALAATLGITEVVEWCGVLPTHALPDFYRSLDIFAIPSHQEGLGIVGVEAAACGLPVVSTRCGGPEDYVIDGESGYLVDATADAMAERLAAITADRALRARLAQGARERACTDYALSAWAERLAHAWQATWGETP